MMNDEVDNDDDDDDNNNEDELPSHPIILKWQLKFTELFYVFIWFEALLDGTETSLTFHHIFYTEFIQWSYLMYYDVSDKHPPCNDR